MAAFERSEKENELIEAIRGSIRRMKRSLFEIDWFDTVQGSDDAEVIPRLHEKVLSAEKMLNDAQGR